MNRASRVSDLVFRLYLLIGDDVHAGLAESLRISIHREVFALDVVRSNGLLDRLDGACRGLDDRAGV